MSNFQSKIQFSQKLSEKRISEVEKKFGAKTVNRIIAIALFLLGGNRKKISNFLDIPVGTLFSLLTRFHTKGVNVFIHPKKTNQTFQKKIPKHINKTQTYLDIIFGEQKKRIYIPLEKNKLIINTSNQIQFKTIILSFMNSGFLTIKETSEILQLSERHVCNLNKLLQQDDTISLIDKRKGQQKDYTVTEEIKAELIQQFSANVINGRSTSSKEITKQLNKACNCNISDRIVRLHISKLGLDKIKRTLPDLVAGIKKTPTTYN